MKYDIRDNGLGRKIPGKEVLHAGMQAASRHAAVYRFLRATVGRALARLVRLDAQKVADVEGPVLILPNHTLDLDFALIAWACPKPMYYVAAEQLFQNKLLARLLQFLAQPIIKRKGTADMATVTEMMKRLRQGHAVCVFPEGNTTFDGNTCPITPAIGRLAVLAGVMVVTYRFSGGYFTMPRWGHSLRRGHMQGQVAGIYTPADIARLGADSMYERIRRDLAVDAYARQENHPIPYRGRRLAQGMENALYACPRCGQFGTLQGKGDRLACACGLQARYLPSGFLEGAAYATIRDWMAWQRDHLRRLAQENQDAFLLGDPQQALYQLQDGQAPKLVLQGMMQMSARALRISAFELALEDIAGMELFRKNTLMFSTRQGVHYQVRSKHERSGLKYRDFYRIVRGQEL